MRTLSSVVQTLASSVDARKSKIMQCGIVGTISVSDDCRGQLALAPQQLAHQAQCSILVPSGLDQNVEHLTFIIDGPPQIRLPTADRDEDFVEMPSSSRSRAPD